VSGPGFVNLRVDENYLAQYLEFMRVDPHRGVDGLTGSPTLVVDYSGPNVAKEMHVGHLRSTIIGDCLSRVCEFLGWNVIRQNHLGDWGTPFGMLIEMLIAEQQESAPLDMKALVGAYQRARARYDADPTFAERARHRVVLLQNGDPTTVTLWRRLVDQSILEFTDIYRILGIRLTPADVAGESTYNAALPLVVDELLDRGIAVQSEGAVCVFLPTFVGRDGSPTPLILRKSDGAYGYAATDLAAIRYRADRLLAKRILYVVGAPQAQHLQMVFATARAAGWAKPDVQLEHVAFGSVLGKDKKMLRTRSGDTISLRALIGEAIERAGSALEARQADFDAAAHEEVRTAIGIGAIKYADLSNDRIKDYVFDWDRMLSFDGNTAPYIMYAHARCRSILRKAQRDSVSVPDGAGFVEASERDLVFELLDFDRTIHSVGASLEPHRLAQWLYRVASLYTTFFETSPVLKAEPDTRERRLALCDVTARALRMGLSLLGVEAPERM
jgi:arginyl-tRNA synthetase